MSDEKMSSISFTSLWQTLSAIDNSILAYEVVTPEVALEREEAIQRARITKDNSLAWESLIHDIHQLMRILSEECGEGEAEADQSIDRLRLKLLEGNELTNRMALESSALDYFDAVKRREKSNRVFQEQGQKKGLRGGRRAPR